MKFELDDNFRIAELNDEISRLKTKLEEWRAIAIVLLLGWVFVAFFAIFGVGRT